MDGEILVES